MMPSPVFVLLLLVGQMYQVTFAQNIVEVYFVVDRKVVDIYLAERTETTQDEREAQAETTLRADIDYFVAEIHNIFASLANFGQYSSHIEIRSLKVDVLNSNLFNTSTSRADVASGLQRFDTWLAQQNVFATLNYDMAVLLTGYDLWSSSSGASTVGYAHMGRVCDSQYASALVEMDGTYSTVVIAAHEMAHVLGVGHDGSASNFLMAERVDDASTQNRWSFSICAPSDINAVLSQLGNNCLGTTNAATLPATSSVTAGLADPNTVCRRKFRSQDSYMCQSTELYGDRAPRGDAVCKFFYCSNPSNDGYCRSTYASDGMICNVGQRCNDGTCQPASDSEAAAVTGSCLFGDSPQISMTDNGVVFAGTCGQFLPPRRKHMCYYPSIRSICCSTCASYYTGVTGCEYGDLWNGCTRQAKSTSCSQQHRADCCQYCRGYTGRRSIRSNNGQPLIDLPPRPPVVKINQKKEEETTPGNSAPPKDEE